MRKDWKYILYITLTIVLFVTVKVMAPKKFDWTITFAHDDKDPYGGYVLYQLLDNLKKDSIHHSYYTLYELKDSINNNDNILIVTNRFSPAKTDIGVLLNKVHDGATAIISAQQFAGDFADTLNLKSTDNLFSANIFNQQDSAFITFVNDQFQANSAFWYKRDNIHNYFKKFDTLRTSVIARNDYDQPVTLNIKWGKGNLVLNCTPLTFTNIYLLPAENHRYAANTFSYFNKGKIYWTEYYHLGKRQVSSPLRFILSTEPLRWAYYLAIFSVLIFMIFEAKRRQRIIPIMKPLSNTSLEFVTTIGNLYYKTGSHKNIADKKIQFLLEQIRTKYRMDTRLLDEEFIVQLSLRSGKALNEIRDLVTQIKSIQNQSIITSDQLIDLNNRIEKFNQ